MKISGGLELSAHQPGLTSEYLSASGGLKLCLVISEGVPDPTFVFRRHVEAELSVHVPLFFLIVLTSAPWAFEISVLLSVYVCFVSS